MESAASTSPRMTGNWWFFANAPRVSNFFEMKCFAAGSCDRCPPAANALQSSSLHRRGAFARYRTMRQFYANLQYPWARRWSGIRHKQAPRCIQKHRQNCIPSLSHLTMTLFSVELNAIAARRTDSCQFETITVRTQSISVHSADALGSH
eukprot:COSAG02_NODE_87_length_38906_cov_69.688697_17_plen_150_part_00